MFALRHIATGRLLNISVEARIDHYPYEDHPSAMVEFDLFLPSASDPGQEILILTSRDTLVGLLSSGETYVMDKDLKLPSEFRLPGVVEIVELKVV